MAKKFKIKFLAVAVIICFAGIVSSCYYDYGIDPNNSNVVITAYDNTYDFSAVTNYFLIDTVQIIGGGTLSNNYQSTIIPAMITNLNGLGWQRVLDTAQADVIVGAGVTSSTVVVNSGYGWYGYYGYSWYYPSYYDYSYSYTTGTLAMLIADYDLTTGTNVSVIWSGILNGAAGQSTPTTTLINTGINQAFSQSQSPYLY